MSNEKMTGLFRGSNLAKNLMEDYKNLLAGAPILLDLPTITPHPSNLSSTIDEIELKLTSETSRGLYNIAKELETTPFVIIVAAMNVLFSRYSGQTDLLMGVITTDRIRSDMELTSNILVIRNSQSHDKEFTEFLSVIMESIQNAFSYVGLSFERLVDAFGQECHPDHSPIIQVVLVYQDLSSKDALPLNASEIEKLSANFDLTFNICTTENQISVILKYNADLYEEVVVERMAGHFAKLTNVIVNNPDTFVCNLPILSQEEQHLLLEWNNTASDYPSDETICSLFEAQVEQTPKRVAVLFGADSLSYAELNSKANQLAQHLITLGIGPGSLVGICIERSLDIPVALFGVLKSGAAYIPLDPAYPEDRLRYMLEDSSPVALLTQGDLTEQLSIYNGNTIRMDCDWEMIAENSTQNPCRRALAPDIGYVIYTSGSTGRPKGVMITHSGVVNFLFSMLQQPGFDEKDVILNVTSLSFDIAVLELILPLICGARTVIVEREAVGDPALLGLLIKRHAVSVIQATPATWRMLLDQQQLFSECRIKVFCGGEVLSRDLAVELLHFSDSVWNLYGPTETTIWSAVHQVVSADANPLIGCPIGNTQIYILDCHLNPVPIGVMGELYIGGHGLAQGYLNQPELTANKFVQNPFKKSPGERIYRTGDLARYMRDGTIEYMGRTDHQVKVRGFRIELGEIEALMLEESTVDQAVVVAREDPYGDKVLTAYVTLRSSNVEEDALGSRLSDPDEQAMDMLRDCLAQRLPKYMIPAMFVVVDALPLTPNGKIDRKALPVPKEVKSNDFSAPQTHLEKVLADIWGDVLHCEKVSNKDNFFTLGGHSVLAAQIVSRIRSQMDIALSIQVFFENPSVEEQASLIAQLESCKEDRGIQHVSITEPQPLSFGQERLWFLECLEPGSPNYNVSIAIHLWGELDRDALRLSLDTLIERHDILRTYFELKEGKLFQIADHCQSFPFVQVDLELTAEDDWESKLHTFAYNESRIGFNLETGPIARATLLYIRDSHHVLILTMHHIITDDWSVGLLLEEMISLYRQSIDGKPKMLQKPVIRYADFAVWQRSNLSTKRSDCLREFWVKTLSDAPREVKLPFDRARGAVQTYNGRRLRIDISGQSAEKLYSRCKDEQVTPFMLFLAGLAILLKRYSGENDLVIGTPVASRSRIEFEQVVGFFVNTLVLRIGLSNGMSSRQLLARIREISIKSFEHEDMPFEQLVESLQSDRDISHSPLFNVLLAVQGAKVPRIELPSLTIDEMQFETGISKFDLSLLIELGLDNRIEVEFEYNTDLFEQSTISRFARYFVSIITFLVEQPEGCIDDISLLTGSEREEILTMSQGPTLELPKYSGIHQLIEETARRIPDHTAAWSEEGSLSYSMLELRANEVAVRLRWKGVGPGSSVGIYVERSINTLIGIIGILKAGGAYVPLDPSYPSDLLAYIVEDSKIDLLLAQSAVSVNNVKVEQLQFNDLVSAASSVDAIKTFNAVKPDDTAYIIYTSGSTGRPNGVRVSHRNLVNSTMARLVSYNEPVKRFLLLSPLAFDSSVAGLFWTLCQGGQLVIPSYETIHDPESIVACAMKNDISHLLTVPSLYRHLLAYASAQRLPSLKVVIVAGESLACDVITAHFKHLPDVDLFNEYGPTETTVWCSVHQIIKDDANTMPVPIGKPIVNTGIYVLDEKLQLLPLGAIGELYIGGLNVTDGYVSRSGLSERKFLQAPFIEEGGERFYRTGDLGRYRIDGVIEFLGRADEQVKINGFRIEPGHIERRLIAYEGVREAAVVVQEKKLGERHLLAFLVWNNATVSSVEKIREWLELGLPRHMIPSVIEVIDSMPLTHNGKVDKRTLSLRKLNEVKIPHVVAIPQTIAEQRISEIWKELLQIDQVDVNSNFFHLGGHSLLAAQIVSRIRSQMDIALSIQVFFENPSVEEQASLIAQLESCKEDRGIQHVSITEPQPLSFGQERLWFLECLEPGSPNYNVSIAIHLWGELDRDALRLSLDTLIERHDILRTYFELKEGKLFQIADHCQSFPFVQVDLELTAEDDWESKLHTFAYNESRIGFNLETGPIARATLLYIRDSHHVLILTMHHIITDDWSVGLLLEEMISLYRQSIDGKPKMLQKPVIRYADFAVWQRSNLSTKRSDCLREFWVKTLSDAPREVKLPFDRARGAVQTYNGRRLRIDISGQSAEKLYSRCKDEQVTPFMLFLAGLAILLKRYSGENDLVIGTPVASRSRIEFEQVVGFFVNTLVLRIGLSNGMSSRQLLARIREISIKSFEHEDMPFEQLVESLQSDRDISHSPLFNVLLAVQGAKVPRIELPSLTIDEMQFETGISKFDLSLLIELGLDNRIEVEFEYNTDLFEQSTISRFARYFVSIITFLVEQPEGCIDDISLLTGSEREEILTMSQGPTLELPKYSGIHQLIEETARRIPDHTAAWSEEGSLSYSMLELRANEVAVRLRWKGVGPGSSVGIYVERSINTLIGIIGILKAGGAYVPLDPSYPSDLLAYIVEDSKIDLLLAQSAVSVNNVKVEQLQFNDLVSAASSVDAIKTFNAVKPDDTAYIIYTSGSTGRPNGVRVSHRNLVNSTMARLVSYNEPVKRFLLLSPLAFDSSVAGLFWTLCQGGQLVIPSYETIHDPESIVACAMKNDISHLLTVPSLYRHLLAYASAQRLPSLKVVIVAGESLACDVITAHFKHLPDVDLFNEYGPTETTVWCSVHQIIKDDANTMPVPIGKPIVNTGIYVLDEKLQLLPLGAIGELYIGGLNVTDGYVSRSGLSERKFLQAPFIEEGGERFYRTGDLGRYRIDGVIEFLGRADEQVKINGFRIEPGHIERRLIAYEGVREAAVVVQEKKLGERHLLAFLVWNNATVSSVEKIREWLELGLPRHMIPSVIEVIDSMPLTHNGKVDKRTLSLRKLNEVKIPHVVAIPQTIAEQRISEIWKELLQIDQVDVNSNFFHLGGHSLLLANMQKSIKKGFKKEISIVDLFRHPTIRMIAQFITGTDEKTSHSDRSNKRLTARGHNRKPRS